MAVGDVVNGISAANTVITLQPAVGVECVITFFGTGQVVTWGPNLTNGVNIAWGPPQTGDQSNCKLFINNTNYLYVQNMGAGIFGSYSGIQIK